MADNILLNAPSVVGGKTVATKEVGGVQHEQVILEYVDGGGNPVEVSATNPLPVLAAIDTTGLATSVNQDTEITALNALVIGQQSDALTDTELRATPVPISGTVNTGLTQPLTDAQLRATPVPVSATITPSGTQDVNETQLGGNAIDTNSGNKSVGTQRIVIATDQPTLTNPIPVSATALPLPTGASTSALQTTGNTSLASIDIKTPVLGQALAAASSPVVLTAAEEAILSAILTITDFDTKTGSLTETAPATDTASSGLNGRLQRVAQRLTSLIALLPTALGAGGGLKIDGSGTALPITGTVAVTGAGDASASNQTLQITQETAINTVLGLISDAIVAAGATGSISAKLRRATQGLEDLKTLIVLAAGSAIIGKVGIDQTTPGTTNGVQVNAALPAGANVIGHVITDIGSTTAVTGTVTTSEAAPTTVLNGKTNVTTAGTRVVLAASTACKSVTIKALSVNTGLIYVGSSTVSSANGFQLSAGDTISLDIANLNTINIDSAVNGEGVSYLGNN